ncbi:MAG: M61 family metallopeptidase [Rhodocyclaceae bacterium]|nr:M61 family metallopeptidase [Rhodocyclaceae bacterium]MBX3670138.1 M61 family metallopeptidase [Rhodocyclaceae bacterium]
MSNPQALRYTITPADPAAHLFEVRLRIERPDPAGQRLAVPAWIPGSYLIREFARHFVAVSARAGEAAVALEKLDKHTWRAAALPTGQALEVCATVYAWDWSVRGAHLDASHAFFNPACLCLRVLGQESAPCLVDIRPPAGLRDWQVATTLAPARGRAGAARQWGFGLYAARDYDDLIDHPVECGRFTRVEFMAAGVPHAMVITGRHDADCERLAADLAAVCEAHCRLFEPGGGAPPFARYLFLTSVTGDGYGGLEHCDCTALIASRNDLPHPGMDCANDAYRGFLGLCSHEYFHAWNVKRIRPAALLPYDYDRENYTQLLWLFEGFTSYYDDLALVRAGLVTPGQYFDLLAKTIAAVERGPGRSLQSVAESSFDAWIKYYRQDENAPNAIVSYYQQGALVALALDLSLRSGRGRRPVTLDDLMRLLWTRYGDGQQGVPERGVAELLGELTGRDWSGFFERHIHGTEALPLTELFAAAGIALTRDASGAPSLGVKAAVEGNDLRLAQVLSGGAAHRAGLSAGDVLVALDGLRITASSMERMLVRRRAGEKVEIHAFRRDELLRVELELQAAPADRVKLTPQPRASANARKLYASWLGQAFG